MPSRTYIAFGVALSLLAPTLAGAAAAAPKKPPAEDPEIKMGREAHEELLKSGIKLIRDPKVASRVETIGKKIADIANDNPINATFGSSRHVRYDYKFFVVDEKAVNAYSLPGGYIYVTKGLYDYVQSDHELAGVLGHEIIHAAHHHVARLQKEANRLNMQMMLVALAAMLSRSADALNVAGGLQYLAIQKINGHGQNAERDADHAGVILARKAGYNPVGALTVMERFARDEKARPDIEQGIFRTHPPSRERASAMIAQIGGMGLPVNRRDVTNAIRASTRTAEAADARVHEVVIDGKVMFRSASPERAKEAAEQINRLLDENLQINEVKKSGTEVTARRRTIISVRPDDTALAQGVSAEAMADQAYQVLRTALWKQFLEEN